MEEDEILKNKSKECLKCGAETDANDKSEFFCSQCGAPVVNRCSNYECEEILKETAKFCKYCGHSSIFENYGLLEKKSSPANNVDDLPF